jgi:hypothetical protein
MRVWPGRDARALPVLRALPARALWDAHHARQLRHAEPGVLFIDPINAENNLAYRERISATNPCGEIPLPPYGACDLGSLNLTASCATLHADARRLDLDAWRDACRLRCAARQRDRRSRFPCRQAEQARGSRRIGLGITGLADALIMLGLRYDSEAARRWPRGDAHHLRCRLPGFGRAGAGEGRLSRTFECRCGYLASALRAAGCRRTSARGSPGRHPQQPPAPPSRRPAPSACWPTMSRAASSRCFSPRRTPAGRCAAGAA